MSHFTLHTPQSAKAAAQPVFNDLSMMIGFIPNVFAVMGGAPPALIGFTEATQQFGKTTLSATEREIVHIATSVENECRYCVAGHTAFAKAQKVDDEIINAVRTRGMIADPKLSALHAFCRELVVARGHLDKARLEAFLDAGYTKDQVLEIILGIGEKTISNLTSILLDIPVDDAFEPYIWTPDVSAEAA